MSVRSVPGRAWVVSFAGMSVNLCLGILYAWSVWKATLTTKEATQIGQPIPGSDGWSFLTNAEATWAYVICGLVFAVFMIPGGKIQDRYGPRMGASLAGVFLGGGCILAGWMKSYLGLILGFGLLGGIGMGLGYAAATPAAVKWFGPHRRGLIVGLVVAGYGGAAIYISPLAKWLIAEYGLTGSFVGLGVLFAVVILIAAQFLTAPPKDYVPPMPVSGSSVIKSNSVDFSVGEMLRTWQFFALVFLFIGSAQSGLFVIANAAPILNQTAATIAFFAANAWILSSFNGLVNAVGRVGTGSYSDRIGRTNAYFINGLLSACCLFALPWIIATKSVPLLFLAVGVVIWQYGGALALMPAFTADYFGTQNLGMKYGMVFLGWGIAFFVPQVGAYIKDLSGRDDLAFYLSGGILLLALIVSRIVRAPRKSSDF
jgi:OFA family oxalate/formate antiporter-like MFS transporter